MTKKITNLLIGGNSLDLGGMGGMPDYQNGIELPEVGQIFVAPEDGFVSVQSIQYNDKVKALMLFHYC